MSGSDNVCTFGELSLIISLLYSNRQDAREALDIAVRGQVKCHYVVRPLRDLKGCVIADISDNGLRGLLIYCHLVEYLKAWSRAQWRDVSW